MDILCSVVHRCLLVDFVIVKTKLVNACGYVFGCESYVDLGVAVEIGDVVESMFRGVLLCVMF